MRSRRSDSTYLTCWEDYSSPLLPPQHEKQLEQLEAEINPALNDDPQVALSYLLTKAIDNMKAIPEVTVCTVLGTYSKHSNILLPLQTWIFHDSVPAKNFPDYYKIIRRPMDLGSMRKVRPHTPSLSEQSSIPLPPTQSCQMGAYHSRAAFMADLNQIRENSLTYNGPNSKITHTAERMILVGTKTLDEVGVASGCGQWVWPTLPVTISHLSARKQI